MIKSLYFDHDYDARNDEKILSIRSEFDWAGYGIFFAILEVLCEQGGYIQRRRLPGISMSLSLPLATLEGVLKLCLSEELLKENENGIFSQRILNHLSFRQKLSDAGTLGAKVKEAKRKPPQKPPIQQETKLYKNSLVKKGEISGTLPMGKDSDIFQQRKEFYNKKIGTEEVKRISEAYSWFINYINKNNSNILKLKTFDISDFNKITSRLSKNEVSLADIMPKFDKLFYEYSNCENANEALNLFIDKYYPKPEL
jgi:hypothetical protein